MLHRRLVLMSIAVVMACLCGTALAGDELESIVRKKNLTGDDKASITVEVMQRVKNLVDAGTNLKRRRGAHKRLIDTAKINNASQVGLKTYVQACSQELAGVVVDDQFEVALDAVQIVVELYHPDTADALSKALESKHLAVRYRAARGIQRLHKKLANRQSTCQALLAALGQAGATEKNEIVLRSIYQAINFSTDVSNFRFTDDCAKALNTLFAGRLHVLAAGSHDEWKDSEGFEAAVDCYATASLAQQRDLLRYMVGFLSNLVHRYFDNDTAKSALPTLSGLAGEAEKGIQKMMKASKVQPPSNRVSRQLKASRRDENTKKQALDGLAEFERVLHNPPWNLP